jgi:hypothetical protein
MEHGMSIIIEKGNPSDSSPHESAGGESSEEMALKELGSHIDALDKIYSKIKYLRMKGKTDDEINTEVNGDSQGESDDNFLERLTKK